MNDIYKRVAIKLGLSEDLVAKTYKSYWNKIKDRISIVVPSDVKSKGQLDEMMMSFSIPFLGKFYVDYNIINAYNKKHDEDIKEDNSTVHNCNNNS